MALGLTGRSDTGKTVVGKWWTSRCDGMRRVAGGWPQGAGALTPAHHRSLCRPTSTSPWREGEAPPLPTSAIRPSKLLAHDANYSTHPRRRREFAAADPDRNPWWLADEGQFRPIAARASATTWLFDVRSRPMRELVTTAGPVRSRTTAPIRRLILGPHNLWEETRSGALSKARAFSSLNPLYTLASVSSESRIRSRRAEAGALFFVPPPDQGQHVRPASKNRRGHPVRRLLVRRAGWMSPHRQQRPEYKFIAVRRCVAACHAPPDESLRRDYTDC